MPIGLEYRRVEGLAPIALDRQYEIWYNKVT